MQTDIRDMTHAQVLAAEALASGRYWGSASRAQLVDFGDCARAEFYWPDGAAIYMLHDERAEAIEQLESLGFQLLPDA